MEDRPALVFGVVVGLLVLTWILVPLRCYARLRVVRRLGLEDYIMIVAQIFATVDAATIFNLLHYGLGKPDADIPPSNFTPALYWYFIGEIFYASTIMMAKISICLLLLRLMANKIQQGIVYAVLILMISTGIFCFFWVVFQCRPIAFFWDKSLNGSCNVKAFHIIIYLHSAVGIVTDWVLAILPFFVLWRSKLSLKTKIGTGITLSLGAFASISTVIRIIYIYRYYSLNEGDVLYDSSLVLLWSYVEEGLAIMAGCIATFRPLFAKVRQRVAEDTSTRGRSGRPAQPFDTQEHWDPGLTIGAIGAHTSNLSEISEEFIFQGGRTPDVEKSSLDLTEAQRSDSTAPLKTLEKAMHAEELELKREETSDSH